MWCTLIVIDRGRQMTGGLASPLSSAMGEAVGGGGCKGGAWARCRCDSASAEFILMRWQTITWKEQTGIRRMLLLRWRRP